MTRRKKFKVRAETVVLTVVPGWLQLSLTPRDLPRYVTQGPWPKAL